MTVRVAIDRFGHTDLPSGRFAAPLSGHRGVAINDLGPVHRSETSGKQQRTGLDFRKRTSADPGAIPSSRNPARPTIVEGVLNEHS